MGRREHGRGDPVTTDRSFTRDTKTVDQALTMECSRRALAKQARDKAQTAVDEAESALLRAEQDVLLRERHIDLCDRNIAGLLDERLRSVEPETLAEQMVDAG